MRIVDAVITREVCLAGPGGASLFCGVKEYVDKNLEFILYLMLRLI
ncbi:MAG: hypothetical protein RO469_04010 [Thermincola sp.]|jgi:hypothetical protein|nr:hypothetical protein [Thermincola sp.]MDT3704219.1 hypothetical protein [Thermincola sp.]